jgi:hypothetical protein
LKKIGSHVAVLVSPQAEFFLPFNNVTHDMYQNEDDENIFPDIATSSQCRPIGPHVAVLVSPQAEFFIPFNNVTHDMYQNEDDENIFPDIATSSQYRPIEV